MCPIEVAVLYFFVHCNLKKLFELLHERLEQEALEDCNLNFFWQLVEESKVTLLIEPIQLILTPKIVEIIFKVFNLVALKSSPHIKLGHEPKEPTQVVSVLVFLDDFVIDVEDVHKVAHNVRKHCYTREKNNRSYKSLSVVSGVIVSQANS